MPRRVMERCACECVEKVPAMVQEEEVKEEKEEKEVVKKEKEEKKEEKKEESLATLRLQK